MKKDNNDMKQFSQPNFPAQEAWKSMQEMLNKEMPLNEKRKKRLLFFWFTSILLIGGSAFFMLNKNSTNNGNIATITGNMNISKQNENINSIEKNYKKNEVAKEIATAKIDDPIIQTTEKVNATKNIISSYVLHNNNLKTNNSTKTTPTLFENAISYADITKMKIAKGDIAIAKPYNTENITAYKQASLTTDNNLQENNEDKTSLKLVAKAVENKSEKNVVKVPKPRFNKSLQYGLQWNIVLPQANSYLDYRAKNQPLTIAIPEFWISKQISSKSEIGLQLNPFAQYTLRNNNILSSANYLVSTTQGSGQSQTTTNYAQSRSLVKAMGVELTAKYTYKINNKLSVAVGIGNNWLNAAVINEKIKGNSDKLVHDSIYGIAKGFKEWDYLKSSFFVGRAEALYQFKNIQVGVAFLKPLGSLYSLENNNTSPINGRLVLRWKIK